jgi:hypothetical protein
MELMKKLSAEKISDYRKHAQMINRIRNYPFTALLILIVLIVFGVGLAFATTFTLITFGMLVGLAFFQWLLFKVADEL